jgi:hypothetical protein
MENQKAEMLMCVQSEHMNESLFIQCIVSDDNTLLRALSHIRREIKTDLGWVKFCVVES